MALIRLASREDEQIIYNNNLMDEISNFRDKYLKEYRVKNTNISIFKKSKLASHSYPDIKHLHQTLEANLTEEKQPVLKDNTNISLDSLRRHSNTFRKTYRKFHDRYLAYERQPRHNL